MGIKKLGILGGMGPYATLVFFDQLIQQTKAQKDQEHIDTIILNHATIPDRTETILNNNGEVFLEAIKKDLAIFEAADVSNIAIPCNTSHYYFKEIQEMTEINIINMIEETMKSVTDKFGENAKIALMSTSGTIHSKIFEIEAQIHGNVEIYVPEQQIQEKIMEIIYQIKGYIPVNIEIIENLITYFVEQKKCDGVILGCTELSTINLNKKVQQYCVDSLDSLVKSSILLSGKEIKIKQPLLGKVSV